MAKEKSTAAAEPPPPTEGGEYTRLPNGELRKLEPATPPAPASADPVSE